LSREAKFDLKLSGILRPGSMLLLAFLFSSTAASAEPVTHRYTVSVDYAMSRLWVEARFSHPVSSVIARSRDAGKYLLDVRGCSDDQQIRLRNQRMMLPEHGISCMNYTVDLGLAANAHRFGKLLAPENIIVSPAYWLWRPELRADTKIEVNFRLPENVQVSVPWQQIATGENRYLIAESPESAYAPVVFGAFDYREIEVPGALLRVSLVSGIDPMDNASMVRWIDATATDVSLAYGRFPNPSPQVVVIPVGDSRTNGWSAVPFGRVIRDGGETIELQVDQTQSLETLLADWTATHEFSHLMLPYVERKYRWISEGFAQYYQNVLLTRSGAYDDLHAWQKIHEGLERGRQSRPELSPNEASGEGVRTALMKIYWSGAAIALLADVQLRELSEGEESLDDILDRFQACCLPSARPWSGPELFEQFDRLASSPVFIPLYRRFADAAGFPDTSEVFERLGLDVIDGAVRIRGLAELRAIRMAILETNDEAATWREQLAARQ
jgi:predicted metalloprotease with PDZ domain